ncbi:hypothetical protein SAMN05216489_09991 [Streptomyces sp. 3213]|nr:hypothetical protein SAMN05216489_09991 [Streptomyces sp. 3213] [Streptomyces sp. 3213.3]
MPPLVRLDRGDFLANFWDYRDGEHVTILGPTGSGKTWLGYQLLMTTTSEERPGVVLVMKPKDDTARAFSKAAGYKIVKSWPPLNSPWKTRRPPGYVLWPPHSFDPYVDDEKMYREFRRALLDSYKRGRRIVFADETYSLSHELGLDRELVTLWTKARSMKTGLWAASQRPAMIPLWAYSGAEHLFIAYDPDKRARERYDEIGGVDPGLVRRATLSLGQHEWLYIRRRGPAMCIIGP